MSTRADNPGCQVFIGITASVETASWYSLWEAMVAIEGMCVRRGKIGSAFLLGKLITLHQKTKNWTHYLGDLGHIYIEMRNDPIDGVASS